MRHRFASPLAAVALAATAAAPVLAHDVWIEPSSHRPGAGERLEVRLRTGERHRGEPVPRRPERIERFVAIGPDGAREILGVAGMEPAGVVRLDATGTWHLVYDNLPAALELPAGKFESYLAEEGLEHASTTRRERGEADAPGRERYSRSVKALVTVEAGEGKEGGYGVGDATVLAGFDRLLGLELELVPERDPRRLRAGGEAIPFRLLLRGRPAPGVLVAAFPARDPERARSGRTDAEGRVVLSIEPGDRWLVRAVHAERAPASEPTHDWLSTWAALTFQSDLLEN